MSRRSLARFRHQHVLGGDGNLQTAVIPRCMGRSSGAAIVRGKDVAVGKDRAAVVEDDDAVAQQAPALFGMGGPDVGAAGVGGDRGRTAGIVVAHGNHVPFGSVPSQ
jgi:hypothetical protein